MASSDEIRALYEIREALADIARHMKVIAENVQTLHVLHEMREELAEIAKRLPPGG